MTLVKKLVACACAATMLIGMAFAGDAKMPEKIGEKDQYGAFMDMAKMVDDVSKVATCEIVVKDGLKEDGTYNGCVNISSESTSWGWNPTSEAKDNGDGTITFSVATKLAASDALVKIGVQDWDGDNGEVVNVVLKDASGKVLYEFAPAEKAPETPATPDAPADEDKGGDVTNVLALAGIACVALCGVAYASKKRA